MKQWHWIILAWCFVLVSCGKSIEYETLSSKRPEFRSVYELREAHPDSALLLFNRVADTLDEAALQRRSAFMFNEYQVLKAEVYSKNHDDAENDSLLVSACDFYESLLPNQRTMNRNKALTYQYARACYYKAVAEEHKEPTYLQAFPDYLKALWIVDGLGNKRHFFVWGRKKAEYEHSTGLIYDRIARFFYNHDMLEHALECLELSNESFSSEGSLEGIASNLNLMGDVMLAQEKREDAVAFYRQADSVYGLLGREDAYMNFNGLLHRSITLVTMGRSDESKVLLLQALENTNRPWMARRLHFALGYVYNDLQQYDSAMFHYEQSYPLLPRQTLKSYANIVKLAQRLGDTEKAVYYGGLLADFSVQHIRKIQYNNYLITLFENYKRDSKEVRHKDLMFFVLFVVVVLFLFNVIDVVLIQYRKKRHQREIERHERIKESLENEIETTRRTARRKEEEVKALESKLQKTINNPDFQHQPFVKKLETLCEMPICKRVCMVKDANVKAGSAYPELVLSEKQMSSLVDAVDAVFPKFSVKIMEKYPRMKRSDVIYCCMYILGVTEVQAAALTGKTYQAVWTRSVKLHEIFNYKSNLQVFLHGFLKNW